MDDNELLRNVELFMRSPSYDVIGLNRVTTYGVEEHYYADKVATISLLRSRFEELIDKEKKLKNYESLIRSSGERAPETYLTEVTCHNGISDLLLCKMAEQFIDTSPFDMVSVAPFGPLSKKDIKKLLEDRLDYLESRGDSV